MHLPDEVLPGVTAAHVLRLPMRVRFRGVVEREAVLLQGPAGWGEFSPFLEYGDEESARWLASALEACAVPPPGAVRDTVPVNATVPAVAAERVPEVLARFPGCRTAKVKVAEPGQGLRDDVARVAAVRDAGLAVRVDANGGWSVEDALRALPALGPLEYAEQPCASVEELAALRTRLARAGVEVLVAADESVRRAEDPLRVARLGAADLRVVKAAPLGGVRAALALVRECGLPVVVSSALDTSVGIATGVALAAALPALPFACGLATTGLLARDVARYEVRDGALAVRAVAPEPAALQELAAPPDRVAWWQERVARCAAVLQRGAGSRMGG